MSALHAEVIIRSRETMTSIPSMYTVRLMGDSRNRWAWSTIEVSRSLREQPPRKLIAFLLVQPISLGARFINPMGNKATSTDLWSGARDVLRLAALPVTLLVPNGQRPQMNGPLEPLEPPPPEARLDTNAADLATSVLIAMPTPVHDLENAAGLVPEVVFGIHDSHLSPRR